MSRLVPHVGPTLGYRIEWNGLSDRLPQRPPAAVRRLVPASDGALELADGVDLLIHDSQYTPDEFALKYNWGHCTDRLRGLVRQPRAKVRRLALFHHDPTRTDDAIDDARRVRRAGRSIEGRRGGRRPRRADPHRRLGHLDRSPRLGPPCTSSTSLLDSRSVRCSWLPGPARSPWSSVAGAGPAARGEPVGRGRSCRGSSWPSVRWSRSASVNRGRRCSRACTLLAFTAVLARTLHAGPPSAVCVLRSVERGAAGVASRPAQRRLHRPRRRRRRDDLTRCSGDPGAGRPGISR